MLNLKVDMLKEDFFTQSTICSHYLSFKPMFNFVLNLVCFCISSPFVLSSLVLLSAYRGAITIALKIQLRGKFVGILKGTDSVWAVENDACKSIINVLATVEATPHTSTADLMRKLRALAQQRLIAPADARVDKLSCLRKKKYGYFYWERCANIDITEHVRWLGTIDDEDSIEEKPNEESFTKMISKICMRPLPRGGQASWEMLVGRVGLLQNSCRFKAMEEGFISHNETNLLRHNVRIPIVFRLHHTLGDAFALLELLLTTIADSAADIEMASEKRTKGDMHYEVPVFRDKNSRNHLLNNLSCSNGVQKLMLSNKYLTGASMPFSLMINENLKETMEKYVETKFRNFFSFHEIGKAIIDVFAMKIKESIDRSVNAMTHKLNPIVRVISALIGMPRFLVLQAGRSMDNSALHGPELSGEKIVSSWIEDDSGKNLQSTIQDIKNATGTRFSDVILAALSASLYNYFEQVGELAPQSLTVILPSRMPVTKGDSCLSNKFSVGLLPLCISGSTDTRTKNSTGINKCPTILNRLFDVARNSHHLRSNPDYLINFWVIKWLSAVLPEALLRVVLESHSTLVFSNVPGPQEVQILGQRLRNIVFWVPQRGSTGIGFSVLSYGGRMHFSLIADKALIQSDNLLSRILENTVREIDNLHDIIFMSPFSKPLHNKPTASTTTESERCG